MRRNTHGRVNERALIGPEILERQERQRRQEELRQERLNAPRPLESQSDPDTITIMIPATPPRQSTLPIWTPTTAERPRPRRSPSPESSPSPTGLPTSTAPARIELGRGKRARHKTAKYAEGQAQGGIHESQERLRREQDSQNSEDE